jgi:hypothetical protein
MSWNKLWAKKKTGGTPLPASFRGWPATQLIEDPENPAKVGLEVYGGCLSPGGARVADIAATLLGFVVGIDMLLLGLEVGTLEFLVPAVAGIGIFVFVTRKFFAWLFTQTLWMRLFKDRIEIAGWREFEPYQTNIGYTFRLDDHEKAYDEELQYRQNRQTGRYYSNSQCVLFEHGRQAVPLADVYPKGKAKILFDRLTAIKHGFDIGIFE